MMKKMRISRLLYPTIILLASVFSLNGQAANTEQLIKISTVQGDMIIKLYNQTPGHRDNMIKLINDGFYDGQLFHRVIKDFMIQGGDPHSVDAARGQQLGQGGPGYTIPAEFNDQLFHKKGALSAARQGDRSNPKKASSGSQFYIVQGRVLTVDMLKMMDQDRQKAFTPEAIEAYTTIGGSPHLDGSYTVFGQVLEGLDVIDRIALEPCDSNNRPTEDIVYHISLVK